VRAWLGTREPKFPKWRIFSLGASFVVLIGILAPTVHGCVGLRPMDRIIYNPPNEQPVMAQVGSTFNVPVAQASAPISVPSFTTFAPGPASVLGRGVSPPVAKAQMGMTPAGSPPPSGGTGPANVGISGSSISSTGKTGPVNGGLSGSTQPP
jgi:hypothetical protein